MGAVTIIDASGGAGCQCAASTQCSVSKSTNTSNGSDLWYDINSTAQSWARGTGWELVAFKNAHDTTRAGVYVRVDSTVTFNDFNNIVVH